MTDDMDLPEGKDKQLEMSTGERLPPIGPSKDRTRRASMAEAHTRILFAPDTREHLQRYRSEDHTALTLTKTFSRQSRFSSYSTASDEEHARIQRVNSRKADPQTRLPTGNSSTTFGRLLNLAYRTLSINVTETVTHGIEPTKGHVKDIADLEWHKIAAQEAVRRLRTCETQGLDNNQAHNRLHQNGKNVLSPPKTHRFRKMYASYVLY